MISRVIKLAVLLVFTISGLGVVGSRADVDAKNVSTSTAPGPTATPGKKIPYSEFPHDIKGHRQDCSTCHKFPSKNWNKVRTGDDAFPDVTEYPEHQSCVKCHMSQFFKGSRPKICSICHTDPSPRNSTRHPFPNPCEIFDKSAKGKTAASDFVIGFPHDKHIEIVSAHRTAKPQFVTASFDRSRSKRSEESCSVCHTTMAPQGESDEEFLTKPPATIGDAFWLKKGTFKSVPSGHQTCFTCHSEDTGILPAPVSCGACHKLRPGADETDFDLKFASAMTGDNKRMSDAWSRRSSSGTFRHEWFSHVEMSCDSCHNVNSMNTAIPATTRVAITSCAICHATATADDGGALNFEFDSRKKDPTFQCVKCHTTFGRSAIPRSHVDALAAAK
ncbi:MAG: cytochrome c3 family protein [Pyrinomonadaceae bacterium]